MNLPGWTREPLVHFLVLGAIVYVALTWSGDPVDPASRSIEVTREDQAELALGFERVMGRAPTDAELDARIEQYVRDEVLYREALRLGLDQGDAVVRQRMVAKMNMSATAAAEMAEPDDAVLAAYYEENADRYAGQALVTFDQAYFADEAEALRSLSQANVAGDPISLPAEMQAAPIAEVQSRFGEVFCPRFDADGAIAAMAGGLCVLGFGWHLVRLRLRSAEPVSFAAVRDRVENDWRSAQISARKDAAFEVLRGAYRVEIDR